MGNTGNSNTYPYGIRYTVDSKQIFNRVTDETVSDHPRYCSDAEKKVNKLVEEYKAASPVRQAEIRGETAVAA